VVFGGGRSGFSRMRSVLPRFVTRFMYVLWNSAGPKYMRSDVLYLQDCYSGHGY
jgi:hypothetical protein